MSARPSDPVAPARATLQCRVCARTLRGYAGAWCPNGHGPMVPIKGASHKRRPSSPSDRPPVGDEPGSLLDRLEET